MASSDIFLGVLSIFFPPIGVWVKSGICSADSLINILLCMLGYVPGLLHAWYIIARTGSEDYEEISQDAETGRVTYVYVQRAAAPPQPRTAAPSKNTAARSYGTTAPPVAPQPHQDAGGAWTAPNGSSSAGAPVPPTYAEAISGDHKVQT